MAIYRGIGGAGDSTTDATVTAVTEKAVDAAASAASAAVSETNASNSASAASTSATNASNSASNASTSETNASASATAAALSESNASTSETNAASSASAASTSASNAATSETNAAASYDDFDDRYLGAKASAPTTDNDGDALITGALYFNTAANVMQVWTGSAWGALQGEDAAEVNDLTSAVTWANVPDANITQSSVTQHQAALSITESQVSDLGSYIENLVEDTTPQLGGTLDANSNTIDMGVNIISDTKVGQWDTAYSWGDHSTQGYLTSFTETNDLSTAVTWANVPDANITQSSVTQHQAALSITESQISDLAHTTSLPFASITSTPTTLAGYGITDAATSAQGALADSAVQPNDSVTLDDLTITGAIDEAVYNLTGTALDPANGTIQYKTLAANTTLTDSLSEGEAMTLMIDDGSAYTLTFPTITWVNNGGTAPTLATTGYTVFALWKVSTTLYGALVGDGS